MLTAPLELAVTVGPLPLGGLPDLWVAVTVVPPVNAETRLR